MEIRVLGDFDFTREVISGVARLFSYDNGFGYASGILLVLYLMWNMLQHGLNPEKSTPPVKEFIFGIILWLMLGGGGSSAKFDVMLTSMNDPGRFEYIEDVPAIAVVPGWLASNLFGEAREMLEDEFSPAAYSIARGQDPLGALTRMWDTTPPISIYTNNKDEDVARTIHNYVQDCWAVDQMLDSASASVTLAELLEADMTVEGSMINALKVDYNGYFTRIYIGSSSDLRVPGQEYGIRVSCPEAWLKLSERFPVGSTYKIQEWVDGRIADPESLRQGLSMIQGTYNQSNNAYAIATNLFVARLAAEGATTAMAADTTRMVFEAYRKHVFEQAGQAELFKSFMIPVITAMEAFSFFVAPVMMVLTALGGFGLSYIGKYLSLVLYMNLWGFTKVFVDLFTAIAVERAYSHSSNTAFTFADYPTTIAEIEGFLSVASTLTASIPALAMFILYGGAKTLSPFVNSATKGSVDGSAGAPSISSSMNAGVRTMANATSQYDANSGAMVTGYSTQQDNQLGSMSFTQMANDATQSSIETAHSAMQSSAKQLVDTFAKATTGNDTTSSGTKVSSGDSYKVSDARQLASGLMKAIETGAGVTAQQASAFVLSGGVGFGLDDKGTKEGSKGTLVSFFKDTLEGFGFKGGLDMKATGQAMDTEQQSKAHKAVENYLDQVSKTLTADQLASIVKDAGKTSTLVDADTKTKMESASTQYNEAKSAVEKVSAGSTNSWGLSNARSVDLVGTASAISQMGLIDDSYAGIKSSLEKEANKDGDFAKHLSKLGLGSQGANGDFVVNSSALAESLQSNLTGGNGFIDGMRNFTQKLSGSDNSVKDSAADMKVASLMWGSVANVLNDNGVGQTLVEPLNALSKGLGQLSDAQSGRTTIGQEAKKLDNVNVDPASRVVRNGDVGSEFNSLSDQVNNQGAIWKGGIGQMNFETAAAVDQVLSGVNPRGPDGILVAGANLFQNGHANAKQSLTQMFKRMEELGKEMAGEAISNTSDSAWDYAKDLSNYVGKKTFDAYYQSYDSFREATEELVGGGNSFTFKGQQIGKDGNGIENIQGGESIQYGRYELVRSGSLLHTDDEGKTHPIFQVSGSDKQYYYDDGQMNYIHGRFNTETGLSFNGVAIGSDGQGLEDVRNGESVQYRGQEFTRGNATHTDDDGNNHPVFTDSSDGQYYFDNGRMNYIQKD